MIIVEGPDGAGKSTLVARLEQDWGMTREPKAVSSEAVSLRSIGPYVEEELGKGFGWRLYDRFALISSPMYIALPNRTFREEMLDLHWLRMQYVKMNKIDPVIIYCMPPVEVVRKNVWEGSDNNVVKDHIDNIYWNYHAFIARVFNSSAMVWDYTKPDLLHLVALMKWANKRQIQGVKNALR